MILSLSILCATLVCNPIETNISVITVSDLVEVIKPIVETSKTPREIARDINRETFGDQYWNDLDELIEHESHWDIKAINPYSGACGLGQRLVWDGIKYVCPFSEEQLSDPYLQINDIVVYIKAEYGNPEEALNFWKYTSVKKKGRHYY